MASLCLPWLRDRSSGGPGGSTGICNCMANHLVAGDRMFMELEPKVEQEMGAARIAAMSLVGTRSTASVTWTWDDIWDAVERVPTILGLMVPESFIGITRFGCEAVAHGV